MEWWQILLIPVVIVGLLMLIGGGLLTLITYMSPRRRRRSSNNRGTSDDSTIISNKKARTVPKWEILGGLVLVAAVIVAIFIFPGQFTQLLPIILIGAGAVMIYKEIPRGGMVLVGLGLGILWLGIPNVIQTGNNIGTMVRGFSDRFDDNILPTTGRIDLDRTFGNPQVFALANTYRRIDVPPGTELCADPIHMVDQGQESTPAVRYVRSSIEGTVVNIHFYFMPYGESCVLLPPSPDPMARTEENSNHHLTHT